MQCLQSLFIFQFRLKTLLSLLFTVTTMRLSSLFIISIWLLNFVIWDSNKHSAWFYCPVELPSSSPWNSILITDNILCCNLMILYLVLLYIDDTWYDPCISYISRCDKEKNIERKGLDLTALGGIVSGGSWSHGTCSKEAGSEQKVGLGCKISGLSQRFISSS